MSFSERQGLMAELVLMWGSRDTESAAMQIKLLDRQTQKWDFEILKIAVRELIDTWEYQSLPGPKHIHAKAKMVSGRMRKAEKDRQILLEEQRDLISLDDAKKELKALEEKKLDSDTPLGVMIDSLMLNALRARIEIAESASKRD